MNELTSEQQAQLARNRLHRAAWLMRHRFPTLTEHERRLVRHAMRVSYRQLRALGASPIPLDPAPAAATS